MKFPSSGLEKNRDLTDKRYRALVNINTRPVPKRAITRYFLRFGRPITTAFWVVSPMTMCEVDFGINRWSVCIGRGFLIGRNRSCSAGGHGRQFKYGIFVAKGFIANGLLGRGSGLWGRRTIFERLD